MALTKDYLLTVFDKEVLFAESYIRINKVYGDKQLITLSVSVYNTNATDKVEVKPMGFSFEPNLNGLNFIAQGYDYLKTLPEFADAEDC